MPPLSFKDRCIILAQNAASLSFKSPKAEDEFLLSVARQRLPVLAALASFDVLIYATRVVIKFMLQDESSPMAVGRKMFQLSALYVVLLSIYWFSCSSGRAARQGELLFTAIFAVVLSRLVLRPENYIFVAFFIIAIPALMKLRWWIGAIAMSAPVALALHHILFVKPPESQIIVDTTQSLLHLVTAWAVSTLMGWLSDASRRLAYANERHARAAAATEVNEIHARTVAERELAATQALAEARSLLVQREKAANEAKSEFISMLCHEIRTPLNGCLASAEMLLQTTLDPDQTELANTVRVSGSILLSTVSNFLDYFKLEAGKPLDVVRTPLDIATMVGDVHRIMQAMVTCGGEVELRPPDLGAAPRTALGDPARLCGILLNLYMNAAKFTKRGVIQLKVHAVSAEYKPSPRSGLLGLHALVENDGHVDSKESSHLQTIEQKSVPLHQDKRAAPTATTAATAKRLCSSPVCATPHPSEDSSKPSMPRMSVKDEGSGWLSTCSEPPPQSGGAAPSAQHSSSSPPLTSHAASPPIVPSSDTLPSETHGDNTANSMKANGGDDGDAKSLDAKHADRVRWICFEVADTGCGVPSRSLHALFHNYVQGDDEEVAKPRTRSGTGLGLAICSRQVTFMGGVIGALTKPDVGSVFWFKVPMIVPDEEADQRSVGIDDGQTSSVQFMTPCTDGQDRRDQEATPAAIMAAGMRRAASHTQLSARLEHQWSATNLSELANNASGDDGRYGGSAEATSSRHGSSHSNNNYRNNKDNGNLDNIRTASHQDCLAGLRILIAEDNLINRKVACRVLQSLGLEIEFAVNGRDAVEAVARAARSGRRFDAILMDLCMPVLGGTDATREIRAMDGPVSRVPIVAMTANAMSKDRDECLAAGMDAFLSKPVLREQLAECILRVCNDRGSEKNENDKEEVEEDAIDGNNFE